MSGKAITIQTSDGRAAATVFEAQRSGSANAPGQPGVILYMDAFGPRPALDHMALRIAARGYAVLVPDLFYRNAPYGPFDARTAFSDPTEKAKLMALISATTPEMTQRDSGAFIGALKEHGANGPIGAVGYCLGGGRALNAAAAYPESIAAAASFHGGNLANDKPDSPQMQAQNIQARIYVGSAATDNSFPPEQSAKLAEAFRRAGIDHIIENYVGTEHGWCVPDHGAYNEAGAERHWSRLNTFFAETLDWAA